MRVGMNVEQLVQDGVSGIATYTAELVRTLPRHGWDVTAFTAHHARARRRRRTARGRSARHRCGRAAAPAAGALRRVAHARGRRPDPAHRAGRPGARAVGRGAARCREVPLVVTAHDAAPVTFPETFTRAGSMVPPSGASRPRPSGRGCVIAVSEFSADELAAHTPIPRDRIRVVPNGVVVTPGDRRRDRRVPGRAVGVGDRPYVFWVGTVQPRKNVGVLVEAFRGLGRGGAAARARARRRRRGGSTPASARARATRDWLVHARARSPRPSSAALYAGADLFALPEPARGLRAPGARGDGPGHARAVCSDIPALARGRRATPRGSSRRPTSTAWRDALRRPARRRRRRGPRWPGPAASGPPSSAGTAAPPPPPRCTRKPSTDPLGVRRGAIGASSG